MTKKKTHEEFIADGHRIHNMKYDYSKIEYNGAYIKIIIVCPKHGDFIQTPHDHTCGRGCPKCANEVRAIKTGNSKRLYLDDFIQKATKTHGNQYDYSISKYTGMLNSIVIGCKIHGPFYQAAHSHIDGRGCPKCSSGNRSKPEKEWLDQLGILLENRQHCIRIFGKRIFVDGFNPKTNTVYEFYGDFWHGNPKKYNKSQKNTVLNKTFGELYDATLKREQNLLDKGYKIISIWESEFYSILQTMKGHSGN